MGGGGDRGRFRGSFNDNGPMQARLLAFVIWAAVAASAVFWLLRLSASSPAAPAHTVAVAATTAPKGDLTRVFGAPPAAAGPAAAPLEPALASRFKLLGVAAPREGGDATGLALIAVDGKPARGFKVGAVIDGDLVLQSVHARGAALGTRGATSQVSLELPPLPVPTPSPRAPGLPPAVVPGAGTIATLPTPVVPPPMNPPVPGARPLEGADTAEPIPVPPPSNSATR